MGKVSRLKTLKDLQKEYEWKFDTFNGLRQEAIKRIDFLESMGTICGRWVANEWRTFIDYYEKKSHTTKYEKKYALIQIKKIIKNYNITEEDLK